MSSPRPTGDSGSRASYSPSVSVVQAPGSTVARRSSAKRAQGLYVWIVGGLMLATLALSLFDTYLLLTLMAE